MDFEEIRKILKTSNPKDWLYNNNNYIYTFKLDVRLNILTRHPEDSLADKKCTEEWVNKFSNKDAWYMIAKVYYSGSFVVQYLFVRADGDRIIIGMPKIPTELEISHLQYNMGKILSYRNIEGHLADYDPRFKMSGIEVKKALLY